MAARSIASLSLTFGLVSIPIKVYSATESSAAIRFKLMAPGGARVRQQYVTDEPASLAPPALAEPTDGEPTDSAVSDPSQAKRSRSGTSSSKVVDIVPTKRVEAEAPPAEESTSPVIERSQMLKGYEFEKGQFVLFTPEELKALEESSRQTIDIVSFIPERTVDPIYFDKAYFLAPDKRGAKPYSLLLRAMRDTGRCALAKWAWRSKEYVVQIRSAEGGMVLQQLLYADEVRSLGDLKVELVDVGDAELELAERLIAQISADAYDPLQFVDEEKQRILAAVEQKVAGRRIVAPATHGLTTSGAVVDLMAALRASLAPKSAIGPQSRQTVVSNVSAIGSRKPVKRAPKAEAKSKGPRSKSS